jgi:AraC-like DNA-binding protein
MTGETKGMIAGCIDRTAREGHAGRVRRDPCSSIFKALRFTPAAAAARAAQCSRSNPFLDFLGGLGKARERGPAPRKSALRTQVEDRIEALLPSGEARIERVAHDLGYGRQTLYRRLKAEGTTFESLLDSLRRRLALRLLREEGLSVKETAYRLGFSDPSSFSRAYKRWTGSSPTTARG